MKKLLLLSLLFAGALIQASYVVFPNAKILTANLKKADLDSLISDTNIVADLAEKTEDIATVRKIIDKAIEDRIEAQLTYKQPYEINIASGMSRNGVLKALLQDSSELKRLQDAGALK